MPITAILALEDGRCFEGTAFGATGTTTGEICFNTSMTGYQEVITDPSYRGQIVAMTYPQIGNYGINPEDAESAGPHIRAFVIGELCEVPSNWRSTQPLSAYLSENKILGIEGIDTRALTKHLRSLGAMRACVTTELDAEAAIAAAKASPSMEGMDYVKEVSTPESYLWTEESREWTLPNVMCKKEGYHVELPPVRHRIVAYDFGLKYNILRRLRQAGFEVEVVNSRTTAAEVLAKNPDGLFLSNGPGDPAALGYIHRGNPHAHRQAADFRHLPRKPDPRPRLRRHDIQTEIRPPRRQPAGQGPAHRKNLDHLAEPRIRRRSGFPAAGSRSHPHQPQRQDR